MMSPLPSVETVCGMVQQEESQRDALKQENNVFAMYSKKSELTCSNCRKVVGHQAEKCWACKACGKSGHTSDKCWIVVRFPNINAKNQRDFGFANMNAKNQRHFKGKSREMMYKGSQGKDQKQPYPRWIKGKQD